MGQTKFEFNALVSNMQKLYKDIKEETVDWLTLGYFKNIFVDKGALNETPVVWKL